MSSVQTELIKWAKTLPYWEQAALDKIIGGSSLTDSDYDQLMQYFLEDAGLEEPASQRPDLRFLSETINEAEDKHEPVRLMEISNLSNVNALATGQTLSFNPTLTVIFGANGSGKSGYARILGCAGFSRGDTEVLPDITQPTQTGVTPSADISILDSESVKIIHYEVGDRCPQLSSIYVFDSSSVTSHLTKSNSLSFCPAGLDNLTKLGRALDEFNKRVEAQIAPVLTPHCFGLLFQGGSEVSELISQLDSKTDLKDLQQLAILSPSEEDEITELDKEIAKLKSEEVPDKLFRLRQTINDLGNLIRRLRLLQDGVKDEVMRGVREAVDSMVRAQAQAQSVGVDRFKSDAFKQVGSPLWQKFVAAAKALAEAEREAGTYPAEGDSCLLCRQHLDEDARALLHSMWAFLDAEAKSLLGSARAALDEKRRALSRVDADCFNDQHVSYRHLQEHDPLLMGKVAAFVEAGRGRRESALRAINNLTFELSDDLPDAGVAEIEAIIERLEDSYAELDSKNPEQEIANLSSRLTALRHRQILRDNLPAITEDLRRRKRAEKIKKSLKNTRHITKKYDELFSMLVTSRYVETFDQILKELNCPLKIKLKTRAQKGETFRQIVLEVDPSAKEGVAKPDKILSEGEKRAVALADFLTEVALDEASRGVVLDDPVTSLDLDWKESVARRLVEEAKKHQVIVFTHDMPFLYLLSKYADKEEIIVSSHRIERGPVDNKPGYIYADSTALTERDAKKPIKALHYWDRARNEQSSERRKELLGYGFAALRETYEAFVIYELFGGVVRRFEQRIRIDSLKNVIIEEGVLADVMEKYGLLSSYMPGHLPIGDLAPQSTPEMLQAEIDHFQELAKRHRAKINRQGRQN
jgi:ABC-type lipoprotein export system ATPase subunit